MAASRLNNELRELATNPPENVNANPLDDDIYHWQGTIMGPDNTPYAEGVFFLDILVPTDYPVNPPKVSFTTKIFHPDVRGDGSICLTLLKPGHWQPTITIAQILVSILALLHEPEGLAAPFNPEAAALYQRDRAAFDRTAAQWTKDHASV
ncbi:Ubiquitin-conjugating enzyme E2 4 [Pelomyxa schiedti]|nr:Ubiquitin-conjugating enzyme E2 4 [Pelomyxa schiedti]